MGRLIGSHPAYHMIGTETRFITASGGLIHLASSRTTFEAFERQILDTWFVRGPRKGLHVVMDQGVVEQALPGLKAGLAIDRWAACREFAHRLLDPVAAAAGARSWVEMSPTNGWKGRWLLRMFPDMRLVHSVRDGRDVACSIVKQPWGPTDVDEALDMWANRLGRSFDACDRIPADRVLVVQMERLLVHDREAEYRRLLDFIGLDDDPAMRGFFDQSMNAQRAHAGRWRTEVPPERLAAFEAHYAAIVRRLRARRRPYDPEGPDAADQG
jgi:hypothetical protein